MKNLGRIDLVKHSLSLEDLKFLIGKHKTVKVEFAMDLADLTDALFELNGMNGSVDSHMSDLCPELVGDLTDIHYEMTGFEKKTKTLLSRVIITATASTAELFPEDLDDEDQEIRRRDEKNGLYGEHIDVSN